MIKHKNIITPYDTLRIKARISSADRVRRVKEREGVSLLRTLFAMASNQWEFSPSLTLDQNFYILDSLFSDTINRIRDYYNSVALLGSSFGREQVILSSGSRAAYSIKAEIEITVNWSQADQAVLDWLNNGGDYTSGYFDLITGMMAGSNRAWLTQEYARYINGEQSLQDTRDRLSALVFGTQRADLIIRTNVTDIFARGQQEAYRASGTQRNRWYTRYDELVCPICGPLHGSVARIGENFSGINTSAPSAHAGCRCFLSPVPMDTKELEKLLSDRKLINAGTVTIVNNRKPKEPKKTDPIVPTVSKTDALVERFNTLKEAPEILEQVKALREARRTALREAARIWDLLDKTPSDENKRAYDAEISKVNNFESILADRSKMASELAKKLIYQDNHINMKVDPTTKLLTKEAREGLTEFNRMISDRTNINYEIHMTMFDKEGRAHSLSADKRIVLYKNENVPTVIHDIGHVLEANDLVIKRASQDFLDRRTAGNPERWFSIEDPVSGWGSDEKYKEGGFFHKYVGKIYNKGLTEVVSMGIEQMYRDPYWFFQKDPDHFRFIASIMTGDIYD